MTITAQEELLEIHRVVMCIAEAPEASDDDPYTLREVKRLAVRNRALSIENSALRQTINTAKAAMEKSEAPFYEGMKTLNEAGA